jgi:hypothetical protein
MRYDSVDALPHAPSAPDSACRAAQPVDGQIAHRRGWFAQAIIIARNQGLKETK